MRRLLAALDRMSRRADRPGAVRRRGDDPRGTSSQALADGGLSRLTIPQEYGGLGLSPAATRTCSARSRSLDPSLGVLVGVHCGLGSKAIVLFGTPEQKERYLPMLARGETLAAYALTEPETGSRRAAHRDAARA